MPRVAGRLSLQKLVSRGQPGEVAGATRISELLSAITGRLQSAGLLLGDVAIFVLHLRLRSCVVARRSERTVPHFLNLNLRHLCATSEEG
jgi:hypothetical protein